MLSMGTPRDITGGLTGWTGRPPEGQLVPETKQSPKKRPKKAKKTARSPRPVASATSRATDYFTIFVYSLVAVSLFTQGVIMLSLSVF